MAKLTDAKIKNLEEYKDHLLKEIEEHVNRIMKDRDQLVKTISETQKKIEDMAANGTMEGVAESDIYNAENIVKAGTGESLNDMRHKVVLYHKAYSINPYRDSKLAQEVLKLLDELKEVAKQLDDYYNSEVLEAFEELNEAKKRYNEAHDNRNLYRRSIYSMSASLREAVLYDGLGSNELIRHGAERVVASPCFSVPRMTDNGADMCSYMKDAIEDEQREALKQRENLKTDKSHGRRHDFWNHFPAII